MYFDILIVGGSAAGFYTAQHLAELGFGGSMGVVSEDPHSPYDRTKLSKELLFDGASSESVVIEGGSIAGCEWYSGVAAKGLDLKSMQVWTDVHGPIGFGRLVIASGATPKRIVDQSAPGSPVPTLYTMADALKLRSQLRGLTQATVIGSGFVAAEAASGLSNLGVGVRLRVRRGLFAKYGRGIAEMARSLFEDNGVAIEDQSAADTDAGVRNEGQSAKDAAAHVTIGAIGSEPAVQWLGEFATSRGNMIRTDPVGRVEGTTQVFAAGDVAWRWSDRHRQYLRSGHWASAMVDARTTAAFLATGEARQNARAGLQGFSSTHFGVTLQGIGDTSIADEVQCDGDYRTEGWAGSRFFRAGELCAAMSYGRPAYVMQALPELLAAAS